MINNIVINERSKVTKYQQIINSILTGIDNKSIKLDDKLPSVNEMLIEFDISRDTIVRAYAILKSKNIINSVPGKGYYINKVNLEIKAHIFLLFNKLSQHKKIIYDSFCYILGDKATIDFFIYNNDYTSFKNHIINNKNKNYTHYVIVPHFTEGGYDVDTFIRKHIDLKKLILLDKNIVSLGKSVSSIHQDFENDIYDALTKIIDLLKKYKTLNIIFNEKTTYHPKEILIGFKKFCLEFAFKNYTVDTLKNINIKQGDVFINLMENDLVYLIKKIKKANFKLGRDVGIVSYNETPIKEVLMDGITVISTDFKSLGETTAKIILEGERARKKNPFSVILRKSL